MVLFILEQTAKPAEGGRRGEAAAPGESERIGRRCPIERKEACEDGRRSRRAGNSKRMPTIRPKKGLSQDEI